jgi:hypothetical protein
MEATEPKLIKPQILLQPKQSSLFWYYLSLLYSQLYIHIYLCWSCCSDALLLWRFFLVIAIHISSSYRSQDFTKKKNSYDDDKIYCIFIFVELPKGCTS